MKKETGMKLLLLLASLGLLLYLFFNLDFNTRTTSLNQAWETTAEMNQIKDERQERAETIELDIFFNEQQLIFDKQSQTYFYPIIGESENAANPKVSSQAHNGNDYRILFEGEGISQETIGQNKQHKILVYGDEWYQEFNLVVTTLPIFSIDLDDPFINKGIGDHDKDAMVTLYDTDSQATPSQRKIVSKAQVRYRGASSRIFPQKQIRVSLKIMSLGRNIRNNHLSLLNMREDDDWILYAPYNDPEKMRNTLSNNLWYDTMADNNRFAIKNGTQGRFVEVFINGDYWGIYTLMHPIDAKQLELEENEDPRKTDYYYRMVSNHPIDYTQFDGSVKDNVILPVELRFPEKNTDHKAKWDPGIRHSVLMRQFSEESQAYLYEQTDIGNQIDYWLFLTLTRAVDNYRKNRNYIAKYDGEQHVVLESPWDLDLTWGHNWSGEEELRAIFVDQVNQYTMFYPSFISSNVDQNNQEIIRMIVERYTELRQGGWSDEAMAQRLDEMIADIYGSGAIERNHDRWERSAYTGNPEPFKDYVLQRLQGMDQFIYEQIGGSE
ncbi:CotH kinase family protein [Jeotgalibaca sp. A127]|uniref:CotH kinase family protein n=1 Tax=Jeotgalibaca sp. A127 TaxID=3457324 RepID=UPI003FD0CF65